MQGTKVIVSAQKRWYSKRMFLDHKPSLVTPVVPVEPTPAVGPSRKKLYIIIGIVVVVILAVATWGYVVMMGKSAPAPKPLAEQPPVALPGTLEPNPNDPGNGNGHANDFKGETVTFDAFYKSRSDEPLDIKITGVGLPINTKSQVSNYYEVARKIDIDPALDSLNKNGFAIIENPLAENGNDFFAAYAELQKRGVPVLITNDFISYYYQNSLKQVYDEVKSSYFYESLWKVNSELFKAASDRYQERLKKVGVANDPLLEAERLEAGYFGTTLALLSPEDNQINATEELTATRTFRPSEAKRYQFTAPAFLAEDIAKEVALVNAARKIEKSPLFLYTRDYTEFQVPSAYADNAKLRKYFQASRWQSSLFPLDYKDAGCSTCLLDRDDWTINQIAAYLLAEDLSSRQPLKNEWAKVYKVTAFFSGLRSDLTYLDYQSVREKLYPEKSIEELFASGARERLIALNAELEKKPVAAAAGALSRSDRSQRSQLGLRLLQTPFWPDRYLYDRLTYQAVGNHNKPLNSRSGYNQYLSACANNKDASLYRCRGIGFDILGAVSPVNPTSAYIKDNINYQRYGVARAQLQKEVAALPGGTRHGNNFWSTLDIASALADESFAQLPYSGSQAWSERQISTSLAALTQLALPADVWEAARVNSASGLGTVSEASSLSYLEPNRKLSDQLLADMNMLFKTLSALGVVRENDARLGELYATLERLRGIARAELSGAQLNAEQYQALGDFVGQYRTVSAGSKSMTVSFVDPVTKRNLNVKQTIAPLRVLLLVYEKDGKKVLAAGPIFGYKEE